MSGEKLNKPRNEEIPEGFNSASETQGEDSLERENGLKATTRTLEGQKTTNVHAIRETISAYSKQLDLAEAGAMLNPSLNSPELARDREEARRILGEIGSKLNEFQGLFNPK